MMLRVIKLQAGLGNQMFQYAFGQAQKMSLDEKILYDVSWFEQDKRALNGATWRNYGLGVFKAELSLVDKVRTSDIFYGNVPIISWMKRKFSKKYHLVRELDAHEYRDDFLKTRGNVYYEGYFQNENYLSLIREQLLNDFQLRKPLNNQNKVMLGKIRNINAVSLHVRRGDYLAANFLNVCSLDYYHNAIKWMGQNIENPHFFIFSDDIPWVAEHLLCEYAHTLVDINDSDTDYCDLELMKNCQHQIISNSSFSWWGAWLNRNPDKIVIAPTPWYANPLRNSEGLIPSSWMKQAR
ncbi:MAG: alpha-1,2-fucosyltransferase [Akkermansia sp.]